AHHFFTKRNLIILSEIFNEINKTGNQHLKFWFTAAIANLGKTARYKFKRSGNVPLSGTLYLPSLSTETNVFQALRSKIKQISSMLKFIKSDSYTNLISNQSSTQLLIK